jgi:hypothetical protein
MAINVDTVYQKVLAIANKEQRGYITPQEFNLIADQAQKSIFEQYFNDLDQARRQPSNDTFYADKVDFIETKLQEFEKTDRANVINSYAPAAGTTLVPSKFLPNYIYKIHRINYFTNNCEIVNTSDFNDYMNGSVLFRPTTSRPIANIRDNILRVSAGLNFFVIPTEIIYFKLPLKPRFGYVVVNGEALYNASDSINFQLHPSEEELIVFKILELAGVTIAKPDLVNIANQEQAEIKTQQKS